MVLRSSIVGLSGELSAPSPPPVLATRPRDTVSAAASRHVCLSRLCLCVCLPTRLLVVSRPGRPPQIKEHKGDCCGSSCSGVQSLSVCVCVCFCVCVLPRQGRRAQFAWSRLLLCPLLSLWESFPRRGSAQHQAEERRPLLFFGGHRSALFSPPPNSCLHFLPGPPLRIFFPALKTSS